VVWKSKVVGIGLLLGTLQLVLLYLVSLTTYFERGYTLGYWALLVFVFTTLVGYISLRVEESLKVLLIAQMVTWPPLLYAFAPSFAQNSYGLLNIFYLGFEALVFFVVSFVGLLMGPVVRDLYEEFGQRPGKAYDEVHRLRANHHSVTPLSVGDKRGSTKRYGESVLVFVTIWVALAVGVGRLIDNLGFRFFSTYQNAPTGFGIMLYVSWLILCTSIIAPYLTVKVMGRLYRTDASPARTFHERVGEFYNDTWEFLKDVSPLARTVVLASWIVLMVPVGISLAVLFGNWSYFGWFLAANALVLAAYSLNRVRMKVIATPDSDRHFASDQESIDDYIDLLKESEKKDG